MTLLHEALVCALWEVVISMIVIMMVDRWMKHDCDFFGCRCKPEAIAASALD